MSDARAAGRRIRLKVEQPVTDRLDAWLAGALPELSRTRIARLIEEGHVLVNGRPPRKKDRPRPGDVIEVEIPAAVEADLEAEPIPLRIVREDADLLVIDKPAGLVVHPAPGHPAGTLVNALLHHAGELPGIGGVKRPGIVHRLDKDTSGLMIVAKTERAHRALSAALKRREIRRVYHAAVWGHLQEETRRIEAPIGRSRRDRKRMAIVPEGRPAVTHVTRLERWLAADFVEARLETGRTHQIRVHLASIGHPVVGDREYGGAGERGVSGPARQWARQLAARVPRQFLHATRLEFRHPVSGAQVRLESPLPPDLAAAAAWARDTSGGSAS